MRIPKPVSKIHAAARLGVLCTAIVLAFGFQAKQGDTAQLTEHDILNVLVGTDLRVHRGDVTATAQLMKNGETHVRSADWSAKGHWLINEDRLCFYLVDEALAANDCVAIERISKDLFQSDSGTLLERLAD